MYTSRSEASLPTVNVRVDCRMGAEVYSAIAKGTKWKAAGESGKKGGKKGKGGKKKKK